jgi:hypothetical protein
MNKEKKSKKIKKSKHLNLWCESDYGIEMIKIPLEYSKDFVNKFGVSKIPQRKDLLDWLYEEKNWVYKNPRSKKSDK